MNVQPISLVSVNPVHRQNVLPFVKKDTQIASSEALQSVSSSVALSQMPNVSFSGKHYNYGQDDFSDYDNYSGPQPPQIELEKYQISRQVQEDIDDENYLSAISGKIKLARIVRKQGKERDAYLLENSIRDLYKDLPIYQRNEAKRIIAEYNHDMAKYIDDDIRR